jgi:hypothetical protein|nr:MAG TPA: SacI restriction endonuclease [Caudoviricetes sp.]
MMENNPRKQEEHLSVYGDRSELYVKDAVQIYYEGFQNEQTQQRYEKINRTLGNGYLDNLYDEVEATNFDDLSEDNRVLLRNLVTGVTSEVGRALVGVAFLQLTIKSISPEQSIRLHKGATRRGSFSWVDGISMRTLDAHYNTPFLRKRGLLNVNKYGVFMTRSLAENYPYSKLYKAEMKGPFDEWISIVDALEDKSMPAKLGLLFLMSLLKNRSDDFNKLADEAINLIHKIGTISFETVEHKLENFFNDTEYSARAFEVVMHGFMQAMSESDFLGDYQLVPMSQMRSANKKHGNVGDIELKDGNIIVESWDAKYGKPYLRDELEELLDKLLVSPGVKIAGFVVNSVPDRRKDITKRAKEIETLTGTEIKIFSFDEWVKWQIGDLPASKVDSLGFKWLSAVVESFGQKRPEIAPIDEPCEAWLKDLIKAMAV